ncbi:PC3-like endoprotease variant B [Mizuhopecten yessoensis]|uniref:PC3-like endoprotease variant B n=1 Tax=Mizuhopecten yessoensis TaxID=6573 RepID=A0A210PZY7_MIZYE|nr:PC3-like endoprotease variant B [Mizuhopecten yessoensis]XP_021370849.1 PC3-like endoprotease variant B [Mizuhopecten yessoensis]XP_021370850.1 PC3-like endoprotease variant B [Mizuhopecten yessoensis]XP_021370851.1 PC3-like endoprotease variant B [Mizuhopecten yessoensis]XP_021370852.1 PC3-like endoprotease variant B [Mizuhopecten yessoensis]XP_021370853.1 PC3-like endoprotease variant B [Mizuhopecten yessoensis]XP_021370854.1 PC3-like endoprotease variant B [Mizuhopecten yessoensis]XP_0
MMMIRVVVSCLFLCLLTAHPLTAEDQPLAGEHLNQFLIQVDERDLEAVAREHGFKLEQEHQLKEIGIYSLIHPEVATRSKRSADLHLTKLKDDPRVREVSQLKVLDRVKREIIYDKQVEFPTRNIDPSEFYRAEERSFSTRGMPNPDCHDNFKLKFNDKYYRDSWFICNEGQTGGKCGVDLRVNKAWQGEFTGRNIRVVVLDDGLDHSHPDLRGNYDAEISSDLNDKDSDPRPDVSNPDNSHGTRCAGEIAGAANNGICSVGIAYNCKIGGIRILDGVVTDALEAQAMLHKVSMVDIYSASWGPRDDGRTMEGPNLASKNALSLGVEKGRGGKGSLYVWATGNGGIADDCCGADGYVGARETISIGSINDQGERPCFMEICSSTMATVPSGGEPCNTFGKRNKPRIRVVTTDINGGCILNFEGTSSAAPMAAGVFAVVLEANPDLGWRDMLHIIAITARIPIPEKTGWHVNDCGYHTNHELGFGVLDVATMVAVAQTWGNVPKENVCHSPRITVNMKINSNLCVEMKVEMSKCQSDPNRRINFLEHVMLYAHLDHSRRGDIEIKVTSPAGTMSTMMYRRPRDDSKEGMDFTFMSVHFWGESASGEWTVAVCDNDGGSDRNNKGFLHSLNMTLYGMYMSKKPRNTHKPYDPQYQDQLAIIKEEKSLYQEETIVKRSDILHNKKHRNLNKKVKEDEVTADDLSILISNIEKELKEQKVNKLRSEKNKVQGQGQTNTQKRMYTDKHINVLKKHFGDHVQNSEDEEIEEVLDEIERIFENKDQVERQANVERHLFSKRWTEKPVIQLEDLLEDIYNDKVRN